MVRYAQAGAPFLGSVSPAVPKAVIVVDLPDPRRLAEAAGRIPRAASQLPGRASGFRVQPETVALAAILAFALLIRIVRLGTLPQNVTADEADNLVAVYHILAGHGPGFFGLDWKPAPAFSTYVMAGIMSVTGLGVASARLASVLFSVAALVPFYLLARRTVRPLAALLATLLLASNAWYLNFSRSGWENVWIALFLLVALLCLAHGTERGGLGWFVGAGICAALGLYGYFAGSAILPSLLLYLPIALWQRRQPARTILLGYMVLTVIALGLYAPQLLSTLHQWTMATRRLATVSVFTAGGTPAGAVTLMLAQAAATLRAFVLLDPGLPYNPRYNQPLAAALDPLTGLAYVAGLALAARRWRETALWWAPLIGGLLPVQILAMGAPDGARAVPFAPVLYLFVALALDEVLARPALLPLRWALPALVPVAVHLGVTSYIAWMELPDTLQARQPAVELSEFAAWQRLQLDEARAGRIGLNVLQWQERRAALAAQGVEEPDSSPPPFTPAIQGQSAPRIGKATAVIRSGSGMAALREPHGIAVDRDGNVYLADTGNARVVKLDPNGKLLRQWGQRGETSGAFMEPFAVAVDSAGRVYVLDSGRGVILRFTGEGQLDRELLADAGAYHPRGLFIDGNDHLYLADTGRNRILELTPDGQIVKQWAKSETFDLDQPTSVAVDRAGNLYVAEPEAKRLRKLSQDGRLLAQREIAGANTREGPHLAVTPRSQLVLTDPGSGRAGYLDTRLTWLATLDPPDVELQMPVGVAVTPGGEVWLLDPSVPLAVRVSGSPPGP